MSVELWCVTAGLVPYERAREAQKRLEAARHDGVVPDLLLLLEHPPVYTRGRRSTAEELPMGEDWYRMQGIEVCDTDRGGRVTYHGPGQLVAYPIVDLAPYGDDVHRYVRRIERTMIEALAAYGVEAATIEGLTGVWVKPARDPAAPGRGSERAGGPVMRVRGSGSRGGGGLDARKIGSIGVHVSRGITTHGLAVNVSNDLQPFEWIVPCGIEGCRMTSVSRETGSEQAVAAFAVALRDRFAEINSRRAVEVGASELARRIPGIDALAAEARRPLPLPG